MRLARRCSPPLTWCDAVGIIRAAQFQFYREFRCGENCRQEPTRNGGVWGTPNFRRVTFNQRVGRAKSKIPAVKNRRQGTQSHSGQERNAGSLNMSQTLLVSGIGGGNRTNQGVRFDIQFGFGMGIGWSTGHNSQGSKKWEGTERFT